MKITALIVAGGKGARMGAGINKVFLKLGSEEILLRTVNAFELNPRVNEIVVVTGKEDIKTASDILSGISKLSAVVEGGAKRQQSVYNGLMVSGDGIVLIHDGARALIGQDEINRVIDDCLNFGAAALGVTCKDTLKSASDDGFISGTINRDKTYQIQTPQAFKTDIIKELHRKAAADGLTATDDCAIAEHYGIKVKITDGSYDNIKITTPEDIAVGEMILKRRSEM